MAAPPASGLLDRASEREVLDRARLRKLETRVSPFAEARRSRAALTWTRPDLVTQIWFAEWTAEGRLRQPRFLGLRDDRFRRTSSGNESVNCNEWRVDDAVRAQREGGCSRTGETG
jgi:ATP-dependent DNA ligase